MAHQQGVLTGVLLIAALTALVAGSLWLLFSGLIAQTGIRVGRRLHLLPALPLPAPAHPALEIVTADLHRLRLEIDDRRPGLSMAKRMGLLQAYDDRLLDACRALEVPDTLAGLPEGVDRAAERLRTESLLAEAGLRVPHRSD